MPRDHVPPGRHWRMPRQHRLSPRQLGYVLYTLSLPALVVAIGFAWQGYWHVLLWALAELALVAVCLWHCARHACDVDRIDITEGEIIVTQRRPGRCRQFVLNRWTASISPPSRHGDPICLSDRETSVAVGRLVSDAQRRRVAEELRACLG